MRRICILIFTIIAALPLSAQLLDGTDFELNYGDTLRGALRPERTAYDVFFYDLNLDIDFENQSIAGYNDIHFVARMPFQVIQIDLFDNMIIDKIEYNGEELDYEREYNAVFVDFGNIVKLGMEGFFRVSYHGNPIIAERPPWDGGFTWKRDNEDKPWLGVSCEGIGASLWWPNKDHLSDEPEAMRISCTIPADLVFVGNGTLEGIEEMGDKKKYTWFVNYPINNYNVTLNIGNYVNFTDWYTTDNNGRGGVDSLLLDYWVMPYNLEKAEVHFEQVKPMLACYENYFGKFPFWDDGYKLVETSYAGMEHQTAIAYGNDYQTGYSGYDFSGIGLDFDYIIIHETGHEYWGNLISAADMADLWIHESFCTYSEALYVECMFDYEKAMDYVNAKKPGIGNKAPIYGIPHVNVEGDGDMYNKGMLFLNTLRHVIDDDALWFDMLMAMTTTKFSFTQTDKDAIVEYFSASTNLPLEPVFEQYLEYKDIPALYYSLEKVKRKNYLFTYKWQTDAEDFEMPLVITVGNETMRLEGSNTLLTHAIKKKKKQKVAIDQRHFYISTKKL